MAGGHRGAGGDTDPTIATRKSLPTTMVLPTSWHGAEGSRRLEDHGIRVEHVYQVGYSTQGCHLRPRVTHCHLPVLPQLHNKGPATVTNVTLRLDVPTEIDGRILFYLLELGTEGGISCTQPPGLNPKQVGHEGGDSTHPVGAGGGLRVSPSPSSWKCPNPQAWDPTTKPTGGSAGKRTSRWPQHWRSPSPW